MAHWIVDAIALAYQAQVVPCPLRLRAHSTRGVASSWALARGASLTDIFRAAGWATPNTFARFYSLRVEKSYFQLKEQILKEQITDDRVFFKMPFRPCPFDCGRFLSTDDGHDRCLQCLGFQHAEDAFVDDSCTCCGRMIITSLRSRLSFLKGLAPSAATRAEFSGSSREPLTGTLGDLRVTVRASPPGMSLRTSYSSRSERPVQFPGDFGGLSHGAPSISFGAPPEDSMSIVESGDGLTSSEDEMLGPLSSL